MPWQLKGTPNPLNGLANNDKAGESVAVSQDGLVAVQGVPNEKKVLIYRYNGTTWGTPAVLNEDTVRYGASVSLSDDGTILAVGAPPQALLGVVYLYKYNSGSWSKISTINCPDADAAMQFGESVCLRIDSNKCYLAVGAPTSTATLGWGSVYTFTFNMDTSVLAQRFPVLHGSPPDNQVADRYGISVAISYDFNTLVVGSPTTTNGSAYVYKWSSVTSLWNETPEQTWTGDNAGDYLGTSVSISQDGTKVVVGAPVATVNGKTRAGYVNAYNFNTVWIGYALTNNTGANIDDFLGISVCMGAGGITFVAGSRVKAVVYSYNSDTSSWDVGEIANPDLLNNTNFGECVGLAAPDSDNTLIIGVSGAFDGIGKSYVYYYTSPPLCLTEGTRILTPVGYRPVEQLEKFDYITTADGRNVMIKHVHHSQHYYVGELEAPFLVPAHALADNMPSRDIKLSPDHLVQVGDDLWLSPRGMAKRSDKVVQYDIGKTIHYYAIMTPNYFQDNLIIEDGVVVEAYGARDLVYDEEKKAYRREAKDNI